MYPHLSVLTVGLTPRILVVTVVMKACAAAVVVQWHEKAEEEMVSLFSSEKHTHLCVCTATYSVQ